MLELIKQCLFPDPAAGASDDWYKGSLGTRFAFTTELRDTGRSVFTLCTSVHCMLYKCTV